MVTGLDRSEVARITQGLIDRQSVSGPSFLDSGILFDNEVNGAGLS